MRKARLSPASPAESKTTAYPDEAPEDAGAAKEASAAPQNGVPSLFGLAGKFWLVLRRWFQVSSFSPRWLPGPLQHPATGYLAALLLQTGAVFGSFLLIRWCPEFAFRSLLPVLAVMLVALSWGGGSGLLATLWGALLLDVFVLPPVIAWDNGGGNDLVSLTLFLLVGLIISVIASWIERARRQTVRLALLLTQERLQTEMERRRLNTMLDVLPIGMVLADKQGRFLQFNKASEVVWGKPVASPQDVTPYGAYKAWWPDTGQPVAAEDRVLARALTRGEVSYGTELEIETFDGQRKVTLFTAAPIRDESGAIIGGVAAAMDISERKRLEQALRQSEREAAARASQLEAVFDAMTDAVFVFDSEGRILHRNAADRRLFVFETEPETLAERRALIRLRDENGQPISEDRLITLRTLQGGLFRDVPYTMVRTSRGEDTLLNVTAAPLRDADGRIIGAVMVLRDVTERQQLEHRTHEALQALLAMAEALVQAPDTLTPPQEETSPTANPVAHRLAELTSNLLGCSDVSISALDLERGVSQPLAALGLPPELEQRWWAGERRSARWMDGSHAGVIARLQKGETLVIDMTNPLLCDEPNPFNAEFFLAVPMRIGERLVGLMILNPRGQPLRYAPQQIALAEAAAKLGALVIERERLLREREAAQASELALRQANQQMDTFLGMASHELKTPLTTIILGLQLGQRRIQNLLREEAAASNGAGKKLEALDEQLTRTSRQATRLDRLVNDLLDVSRIQADKLALRLESIDLTTMICEVADEQRQANPQRCIQVRLPPCQHVLASMDAGRIEQVVTNYLTNALKYSAEDKPVEIGAAVEGEGVRVWVRDHGPGIPLAEQEHVWERFHRVPGVEVCSGSGVGLGLGLYISRAIIERHHGQVGVESVPGQGTTFWFILPLRAM